MRPVEVFTVALFKDLASGWEENQWSGQNRPKKKAFGSSVPRYEGGASQRSPN